MCTGVEKAAAAAGFREVIELGPADVLTMLGGADKPEVCHACPLPAATVCYSCGRPLCDFHTVLVGVGQKGDRLEIALCAQCEEETRAPKRR